MIFILERKVIIEDIYDKLFDIDIVVVGIDSFLIIILVIY